MQSKKLHCYLVLAALAAGGCSTLMAQADKPGVMDPPKVVLATREYVKPGHAGMEHDKSEGNFVQAMSNAKWPTHYIGLNALSGPTRALFLVGYDSFDAMKKDNTATGKNKALSAALDHASTVDGALLDSMDNGIMTYDADESYNASINISQMRFLEVTAYRVRPGHRKQWEEVVKMVKAAYDKAALGDVSWATFELAYGGEDETYIVYTWHKNLAEIDHGMLEGKQFEAAMGPDGLKKLDSMYGEAVAGAVNELYGVNPHMSYVPDSWIKADPDFWKVKMPSAAAKPAADKKTAP